MAEPRKLTPAEEARLEQVREQFKEKQEISKSLNSISYEIGIYSGKGGVGKTTVTTNLAIILAKQGKKVGILDCDIDCPNVTRVLKISERPQADPEGKMIPPNKYGVSVMSMGFFQENEDEAIIWRGPMIHNAINQFISRTNWNDIDYLLCDLPPGTSDAPLTVMQTLNLDGFIVVSTPQELAALDAKRSINMIRKLNLKVFGVVENMTGGIFGKGFLQGSQSYLDYLPEKHTDFIFTLFSEEFGFFGSSLILGLYIVITWRLATIGNMIRNTFGKLYCFSFATAFFVYVAVNMGMVLGLIPIVGAPLPILSYGGSSMMAMMLGLGIAMSCKIHKDLSIN